MLKKRNLLAILLCVAMLVSMAPAVMADQFIRIHSITFGDANLDGVLNSDDALFVLKYIKGEVQFLSDLHLDIADVTGDDVINIDDAIRILESIDDPYHKARICKNGDVNFDGVVTAADASLLLQYCNGSVGIGEIALPLADFNEDGAININDVYALLDYLAA